MVTVRIDPPAPMPHPSDEDLSIYDVIAEINDPMNIVEVEIYNDYHLTVTSNGQTFFSGDMAELLDYSATSRKRLLVCLTHKGWACKRRYDISGIGTSQMKRVHHEKYVRL